MSRFEGFVLSCPGKCVTATTPTHAHLGGFRHEAVFYAGDQDFVARLTPFIRTGVAAHQPTLVVVAAAKIDALRTALGSDGAHVEFADMRDVGRNPARIIPAWSDFVRRNADAPAIRGIGEPIDTRRSPAELAECQRHESLLNVAFDGGPRLWLQCPYDVDGLPADVLEEARRSHPFLTDGTASEVSLDYEDRGPAAAGFEEPLPEPPDSAEVMAFRGGWLATVRDFVAAQAQQAQLRAGKASDLVLAVNELATNSLRYGGGRGTLRVWHTDGSLVCEVSDNGQLSDPLIGRAQPGAGRLGGRGLWMVNQLCDLVQIRSLATGTVVRVHSYRD